MMVLGIESKTNQAIRLWRDGNRKEAMRLFSGFRIGITDDQRRTLKIAYECMTGNGSYYESLDIDCEEVTKDAVAFVEERWVNHG